ncbi:MAG: VWA domain-containing protein [Promethearchaeota archaeon]|nr:MAG: VWA domain-containing protein [Candidatus Lokiarchaeota archaeon]
MVVSQVKKKLTQSEEKILELAQISWGKTMKEFYFPPLETPRFIFDYTHKEGFYIDPEHKWQITMNLAETPLFKDDIEYVDYFHAISMHEVSHYEIIPYDGLVHAKLLRAAMKHVNQNFAPIIVNLFADLIIDTMLYKKYPNLILWESRKNFEQISTNYGEKLSDFSRFLFKAYEKMFGIELIDDILISKQEILKESDVELLSEEKKAQNQKNEIVSESDLKKLKTYNSLNKMDDLASKVTKLILKDFEDDSKWENKVVKIAKLLNNLMNDTFSLTGKGIKCNKGKTARRSPGGESYIEFSEDILEIMDNPLENKNRDKLKTDNNEELKRKAEEFAKGVPYSEFGAPARQAGILIDGSPLATWYRALAKNLIEIKIFEEKPGGGQVPVYPEIWRIGDPLEELDIVQTLLNSPIIIPNVTTRKWTFERGPGYFEEKKIPDLLIVLDSSGSMGWNYTSRTNSGRGNYHTALVASFAALHYAAQKGVKFSVINFSALALICPWTFDYHEAEKILLKYQGGGTVLPIKKILTQCEKAEKKALVFIITDFGIYNWSKSKKNIKILSEMGHKIVGFFIGATKIPKNKFKTLLDKVTFYPVKNPKDLINLVIKEVKRYYQ